MEPSCSYCRYGDKISDTEVACRKHGVVSTADSCRAFDYDPLKREPPHPVLLPVGKYSAADFEL